MRNYKCSLFSSSVSQSVMSNSLWSHRLYVAHQTPLSMGFSRQEYWNALPFPSPEDFPKPGNKPGSPALQTDSFLFELQGNLKHFYVDTLWSSCHCYLVILLPWTNMRPAWVFLICYRLSWLCFCFVANSDYPDILKLSIKFSRKDNRTFSREIEISLFPSSSWVFLAGLKLTEDRLMD